MKGSLDQVLGGLFSWKKKSPTTDIENEAWRLLQESVVSYKGKAVGTVAANSIDDNARETLNYNQVFIRDFVPSAIAFLLKGEGEIVKNFLETTLELQGRDKTVDCYSPGRGLMPASFKIDQHHTLVEESNLVPDFGESAIGRVAPVDSGLWWIILLRAYGKLTGDYSLQGKVEFQRGIKLILDVFLKDGFDMFPTMLVTDGSCMIDRRMGIGGHPLEIQALLYSALRSSYEMLITPDDESKKLVRTISDRLTALSLHVRKNYWVDNQRLNEIYRYKTEEYSPDAVNKFNIYPEQIPSWLVEWIPEDGGYFIGNVQSAHMDFKFFSLGNMWAIISSFGSPKQSEEILNLVEGNWSDIIGEMPLKICYPAMEGEEWKLVTGADPKNTAWSYHNGGSWPTLLWQFTLACIKMKRPKLAEKALAIAEKRLCKDQWPEYYDTRKGRFIGKQARLRQTWTIAGYLASKMLLENQEKALGLIWDEQQEFTCICAPERCTRRA